MMAKIKIKYTAVFTQVLDIPEDELKDFSYGDMECNLDTEKSEDAKDYDVLDISKDGHYYELIG